MSEGGGERREGREREGGETEEGGSGGEWRGGGGEGRVQEEERGKGEHDSTLMRKQNRSND